MDAALFFCESFGIGQHSAAVDLCPLSVKSRKALFHAWALVSTRDHLELVGEADTAAMAAVDRCYLVQFSTALSWDLLLKRLDDDNWLLIPEYGS